MTIYSYHDVLHQPKRIHSVELAPGERKIPLYKPVPWIGFLYFAVVELVFIVLARTPIGRLLLDAFHELPYYVVFPAGVVWALLHVEFDGRRPHRWLYSYARFLARPRRTLAGSTVAAVGVKHVYKGRLRLLWDVHAPRLHHGWVRGGVLSTSVPVRFAYAIRHRHRVMAGDEGREPTIGYPIHDRLQVRP